MEETDDDGMVYLTAMSDIMKGHNAGNKVSFTKYISTTNYICQLTQVK